MHKIIAIMALLALTACGEGVDEWSGSPGSGNVGNQGNSPSQPNTPSRPSKPSNPTIESLWEYSQIDTSRFATMRSSNTVPTFNQYNDAVMLVKIQNFTDSYGKADDYLTITVLFSDTACETSCSLRHKKNGSTSGVYTVRESVEGVFSENSFASGDMKKLIKAIKTSGEASISVPLVGVPDAEFEFDFTGYDDKFMKGK